MEQQKLSSKGYLFFHLCNIPFPELSHTERQAKRLEELSVNQSDFKACDSE